MNMPPAPMTYHRLEPHRAYRARGRCRSRALENAEFRRYSSAYGGVFARICCRSLVQQGSRTALSQRVAPDIAEGRLYLPAQSGTKLPRRRWRPAAPIGCARWRNAVHCRLDRTSSPKFRALAVKLSGFLCALRLLSAGDAHGGHLASSFPVSDLLLACCFRPEQAPFHLPRHDAAEAHRRAHRLAR